jgi:hypothetical protein
MWINRFLNIPQITLELWYPFEIVLPQHLDTINNIESNRMDGMEQIVQHFIKFELIVTFSKEEY